MHGDAPMCDTLTVTPTASSEARESSGSIAAIAAAILATNDEALAGRIKAFRAAQTASVAERPA